MRAIYAVEIETLGVTWVSRYFHQVRNARRYAKRCALSYPTRVFRIIGQNRTEVVE